MPLQNAEQIGSQSAPGQNRRSMSLRGLVQLVIGIGALSLVLIKSDATALVEALRQTRIAYVGLAVAASFAVTWLMAYRWGRILAARRTPFATPRLFVYYLVGIFFTSFVPGGGVSGDVARLIYVNREVRNKALVLSTLVYERLVGVFTLLLIGVAATLATRAYTGSDRVILIGEAVLATAFLAIAALMSARVSAVLARWLRAAGARFGAARAAHGAARTIEDISALRRDGPLLFRTLALSIAIRIVWSLGCYAVVWAMGLPLGVVALFAFVSLVDLVRLMPISVGGLGVREWTIVALFGSVGIAQEKALTFAFLAFAPIYLNAIAGGIIYIFTARVIRMRRRVEEVSVGGSET